jgi:hypothetical protein
MAVTAEDVLTPRGRLDPAVIWPGLTAGKVDEKIQAFIEDGAARAADLTDADAQDEAVALWVRYRARAEQYDRMISMPADVTDSDEGSSRYSDAQLEAVRLERDGLLAAFEDLLVVAGVEEDEEYATIQSLR